MLIKAPSELPVFAAMGGSAGADAFFSVFNILQTGGSAGAWPTKDCYYTFGTASAFEVVINNKKTSCRRHQSKGPQGFLTYSIK